MNNRRLYAAGLAIAAVGFILDRTLFSEAGPNAAVAELAPGQGEKQADASGGPEPSQAAVTALVTKLKALEGSRPAGPLLPRDVFSFGHTAVDVDASGVAAPDPASGSPVSPDEFKARHALRSVMIIGDPIPMGASVVLTRTGDKDDSYRRIPLMLGEKLDGYTLISVKREGGGSAVFMNGANHVELIVPKPFDRPSPGQTPVISP